MENLAVYMRISSAQVSNDDVDTRQSAIKDLSAAFRKGQTVELSLATASNLAAALHDDVPPVPLGMEVQAAVQKHASAFLYGESPFEVGIVAGMAVKEVLRSKPAPMEEWTTPEVLAAGVWSALSYQQPLEEKKREALRSEILNAAKSYVSLATEASRVRSPVGNFEDLVVTLAAAVAKAGEEADENALPTASSNFATATSATITALRRNSALDREELDFLWWSQLGRSRLIGKQMTSIPEHVRIVAAGIEGAAHLRRLPCEVHRDIVLKTLDKDPELDLPKLLTTIGNDREKLGSQYIGGLATKWPLVFPLLNALATGEAKGPAHAVKRRASTWGARALLEAGMIRYFHDGAAKL